MRAELKRLDLEPDPSSVSSDPAVFAVTALMLVGPEDGPGEETYELTVCTPEWLAKAARRARGIYEPRHHVVVNLETFERESLQAWLAYRVQGCEADTWSEVAERVSRFAYWEFEE